MLWLLALACKPPETATGRVGLRRNEVLLAHTNDLHAHYLPEPAPWLDGTPRLGGFEAIDAHLQALRVQGEGELIYLDGGDLLTGTPLMELEERGVAGGAMLSFLEAAGCDGWVVGNHEFDRGLAHTQAFVSASTVPVLSANLFEASGQRPLLDGVDPHRIIEHNGLKIGVFGLTTSAMSRLTSRETASQMRVRALAEIARAQVAALEPEVDLVVALTHAGLHADQELAEAVDGIDLIVGGHTHSAVEPPVKVGETWIVQAGSYGRQLGVVRLSVDSGAIASLSGELIPLDPEALPGPPSDAVQALSRRLSRTLGPVWDVELGSLPAPIERRNRGESALGRWGAEAVRRAVGADVGAVNAGGLRADLAAGPVSRGALYQVFPFSNQVASFPVRGSELMGILLRNASRELEDRVPLQMSGVQLRWRVHMGAPEVVSITVGGEPLELDRVYRVATSSFLADQGAQRFGVEIGAVTLHEGTVLDAAVAALEDGMVRAPQDVTSVRLPN